MIIVFMFLLSGSRFKSGLRPFFLGGRSWCQKSDLTNGVGGPGDPFGLSGLSGPCDLFGPGDPGVPGVPGVPGGQGGQDYQPRLYEFRKYMVSNHR